MLFFEIVGIVITVLIVLLGLLYLVYHFLNREADPAVDPQSMPNLKPIPIPTKNCRFGLKVLVWLFEVRRWRLCENWAYTLRDGTRIILPEGFIFDGASIPRPFWGFLSPVGLLLIPGLIHDYGYKYDQLWQLADNEHVTPFRKEAGKPFWDELFLQVGKDVNGFFLINVVAWLGVAMGGRTAWKKHRRRNDSPEEPRINRVSTEPSQAKESNMEKA